MTKAQVAVALTTARVAAMEATTAATEAEEVEEEAAAATTMVPATMDMAAEMVVVAMVHLPLLAASKTCRLDWLHKLQHTLAETAVVAVVCLHLLLRAGCLVWLLPLLNINKVVTVEVIATMEAATTTTVEAMEAVATIMEVAIMEAAAVVIVAVAEEGAVVVAEEATTDTRRLFW
jgi:hypothetical protein